jgi:hypothetical protein
MVEHLDPALPISRQCRLLALPRSSVYRKPAEVSAEDLAMIVLIAFIGQRNTCIVRPSLSRIILLGGRHLRRNFRVLSAHAVQ